MQVLQAGVKAATVKQVSKRDAAAAVEAEKKQKRGAKAEANAAKVRQAIPCNCVHATFTMGHHSKYDKLGSRRRLITARAGETEV